MLKVLEAIYYTRVILDEAVDTGQEVYIIDRTPLPRGMTYKITAYSKAGGHVLTIWSLGQDDEEMTGETLWRGEVPILSGGGQLDLFIEDNPDPKRNTGVRPASIWNEYDPGEVVVSDAIALALRNNIIYL